MGKNKKVRRENGGKVRKKNTPKHLLAKYSCTGQHWKLISAPSVSLGSQAPVPGFRNNNSSVQITMTASATQAHWAWNSQGSPLHSPTPGRARARHQLDGGGEAAKPSSRTATVSQGAQAPAETRPAVRTPNPLGERGAAPSTRAPRVAAALSQTGRVPSALRGQRVPRPRVCLRPRARAPPRKEAREAAAPLRRFY